MTLKAIDFDRVTLKLSVLDQTLLPYTHKFINIRTVSDAYEVIKKMQVRGAPAIAIVGVLSIVIELSKIIARKFDNQKLYDVEDYDRFKIQLIDRIKFLVDSRPTAVNLSNAANKVIKIIRNNLISIDSLFNEIFTFGCDLIDNDYQQNLKLGSNGKSWILQKLQSEGYNNAFSVITICNTGSLATSGYGTALGVIRSLWKDSSLLNTPSEKSQDDISKKGNIKMSHVYCLETRPYNQGARLTAYELSYDNIPSTLIADSMVTYLIMSINKKKHHPPIKACIVGADRIAKNGDTANKIGTYQLALICKQFGIKFIVVAPSSTIDFDIESGDHIIVEERPHAEMSTVFGAVVDQVTNEIIKDEKGIVVTGKVSVAPEGISIWNPSFDITPHELIDAIVTEDGIAEPINGKFDLLKSFKSF